MRRTTQKQLAILFRDARQVFNLPNKNQVFTKLVPYSDALVQETGMGGFSITPYANDCWAITWFGGPTGTMKHNWLCISHKDFAIEAKEFAKRFCAEILHRTQQG